MTTIVPPSGPPGAKIALVGEAPGREEVMKRLPFVGASGRILNAVLESVGLDRRDCYITNVVQVRPPSNNFGVFYDDSKRTSPNGFLRAQRSRLIEELARVKPNVVVPLGAEALKALTGRGSIEKWRGSVITDGAPTYPHKTIPTYHPAFVMRMYEKRPIMELDLLRVKEESDSPEFYPTSYDFILSPTFDQVIQSLSSIRDGDTITFDIETTSFLVRCIGIGFTKHKAICIPFISRDISPKVGGSKVLFNPVPTGSSNSHWTEEEEKVIHSKLYEVFKNPLIKKIAQNYPFDSTILSREFGYEINGLVMDTLVAHHCCYAELPKSLDFMCSIYTKTGYYADYNPSDDLSTWKYNCTDCCVTYEVYERLLGELKEMNVEDFYMTKVQPSLLAFLRMQNRGIDVDVDLRTKRSWKAAEDLEKGNEKLSKKVGYDINPNSPKQMKELFYDKLKLNPKINRKTGKITCDEKALLAIRKDFPQVTELVDTILSLRENKKLIGTFLNSELNIRNQLTTSYHPGGTKNGRLSSSTNLDGTGGNVQQIPSGSFREIYIPPKGYLWIKADLSQAEFRCVAWLAGIRRVIDLYTENPLFDIHTWNASENIYKVPLSAITPSQRFIAKCGVHGGNYGMHARTASAIYGMSYADAKHAIESYIDSMPELNDWWSDIRADIKTTRVLRTPQGRIRMFFGRLDEALFRSAYSFKPQAMVADVIAEALGRAEESLSSVKGLPIIQVHDEIDFIVPKDNLDKALPLIKKIMEIPIIVEGTPEPLIIPTEISYGPNWYDQTEWNN